MDEQECAAGPGDTGFGRKRFHFQRPAALPSNGGLMLYYLLEYIRHKYSPPGFGLFRYITVRAGAAAVTALIIAFWLGPKIIRMLQEHQIGEAAKLEAPKSHLSKAGTPTMGGLILLAA